MYACCLSSFQWGLLKRVHHSATAWASAFLELCKANLLIRFQFWKSLVCPLPLDMTDNKTDSSMSISSPSLSPCNLNPEKLPPALKVPETKTCRLREPLRKGLLCAESSLFLFYCHPLLASIGDRRLGLLDLHYNCKDHKACPTSDLSLQRREISSHNTVSQTI